MSQSTLKGYMLNYTSIQHKFHFIFFPLKEIHRTSKHSVELIRLLATTITLKFNIISQA